jgi:DNA-binding beta-propeller fold protein YncE
MQHSAQLIFAARRSSGGGNGRGLKLFGVAVLLIAGFYARAGTTKTNAPVWPPPPAEARLAYVGELRGPADIGAKPSVWKRVFRLVTGESAEAEDLEKPFGLATDAAGNLVVTDTDRNEVNALDLARKKWSRWHTVNGVTFASPVAVARSADTIFVADSSLGCVLAFTADGKKSLVITNELGRPVGLAVQGERLYVTDCARHQVLVCDLRGAVLFKFGQRGRGPGEFNFPTHVTVDGQGRIYVTDSLNCRVQVFDAAGKFLRAFGSPGDGPGHFARPKGVAVDSFGHAYVVDAAFNNVQIFDDQNRLLLDWGEAGAGAGQFALPNAIAIDAQNKIYVADAYNHRIQIFRYLGKL